ncbi:MAG TPA: hypothetical protein VMR96_00120 [Solirubrobacterales bacterium]|nr:hypothetical protein [Solirubrobacterales bacterium]
MSGNRPEGPAARPQLAAWKLPPIVAGIALPIIGGFYIGGPGLGMAVGALAAATIIVLAVRKPPLRAIVPLRTGDLGAHILVVLGGPLDDSPAAASLTAHLMQAGMPRHASAEVLLVAPCRQRFLDRWTSDLGPGRQRAQRNLAHAVASLAAAGIEARAGIGDENVVQTVEDELRSFPATEVILFSDDCGERAQTATALADRLQVPFRQLGGDAESPEISPRCEHAGGDERLLGQARRPARVSHRRLRAI